MTFKVWVEIEELDADGDPVEDSGDLSFALEGAAVDTVDTHEKALRIGEQCQRGPELFEHLEWLFQATRHLISGERVKELAELLEGLKDDGNDDTDA